MSYLLYFWFYYGISSRLLTPVQQAILLGGMLAQIAMTPDTYDTFPVKMLQATKERISRHKQTLNPLISLSLLSASGAILAVCSWYTVRSIDAPTKYLHVSQSFTGLIIIPVMMGAVDHVTAAIHARHQDVEWVVEATIASSIRMCLFVLPVNVIIAWCSNVGSMTLFFDGFQVAMVFLAVLIINLIFNSKKMRWFAIQSEIPCFG